MINSSNSCCPPDAEPFKEEDPNYNPEGKMVDIQETSDYPQQIEAYITTNKLVNDCSVEFDQKNHCLIFIHDIFGLSTGMNKQLCDVLASRMSNMIVIAPNFFPNGLLFGDDPLKERVSSGMEFLPKILYSLCTCKLLSFVKNHGSWEAVSPILIGVMKFINEKYNVEQFSILGLCWGSYIGFKACNLMPDKIISNISCHPSVQALASMYKDNYLDLVNGVQCPQFVATTVGM